MTVKSEPKRLSARDYVRGLASRGRYHFTSREAQEALSVSPAATKLALNRLSRQGQIASPARGFYVIVPPEYRSLGCLPAEQFIPALMGLKAQPYYAGLLSAAQYYGAAHHRPQELQVFLAKNRRPIECGQVRVAFIARKRVEDVATREFNTARGVIRVSTPEATAIDLAGYPQHAGGLSHVATVLAELAETIDPALLPQAAASAPLPWAQRLGFLFDRAQTGDAARALHDYITNLGAEYAPLAPGAKEIFSREPRWKLIVNATVEPEL
jgi:predicted transcriptional regulator of viral defense system